MGCTFLLTSTINKEVKLPKTLKKQYKFIPSGLTMVDGDTLSVQSFYMLDHEVTNGEYSAFLKSIKSENSEGFNEAEIRNEEWSKQLKKSIVEPMEKLYHTHEAYTDYPVVNVTQKGAELYCEWLEKSINSQLSDDEKVKVRLPLRAEFIRAGAGNNLSWEYSWRGDFLRNPEGEFLCNFTRLPQSTMSRNETGDLVIQDIKFTDKKESKEMDFMSPMNAYYPNAFDIYNLNGNVAEWLGNSDNQAAGGSWYDYGYDVRLQSVKTYESASPLVGFRPVMTVVND